MWLGSSTRTILYLIFLWIFYFWKHSFTFQESFWFSGFFFTATYFCFSDKIVSGNLFRMSVLNSPLIRILFCLGYQFLSWLFWFSPILGDLPSGLFMYMSGRQKQKRKNKKMVCWFLHWLGSLFLPEFAWCFFQYYSIKFNATH